MKRNIFLTAALVCCFVICLALVIADLNGKWTGSIKTPDGNNLDVTYVFKVEGNKLTGTAQAQGEPVPINDGKTNGTDFTFNVTNGDGSVVPHSGKYYGDSISMDVVIHDSKMHTTLKRATDK
jgi:hypothetical protein